VQKHCPVRERHNWARPSTVWNGKLQNAQRGGGSDRSWLEMINMTGLSRINLDGTQPDSSRRGDS
jgi:hypothetical protein